MQSEFDYFGNDDDVPREFNYFDDDRPIWRDADYGFGGGENDQDLEKFVNRLRDQVDIEEQLHRRNELAVTLVRYAWQLAGNRKSNECIACFDEAISISRELIDEGQVEFRATLGKALLFRSLEIYTRNIEKEAKAELGIPDKENADSDKTYNTLTEINQAIAYLDVLISEGMTESKEDLAIALLCRAEYQKTQQKILNAALNSETRALQIWREILEDGGLEHRLTLCTALRSRGETLFEIGDINAALKDYKESEQFARVLVEEEHPFGKTSLLKCVMRQAELYGKQRKFDESQSLYDSALEICRVLINDGVAEVSHWLPYIHLDRARLYRESRNLCEAIQQFDEAIEGFRLLEKKILSEPQLKDELQIYGALKRRLAEAYMDKGSMLNLEGRRDESQQSFEAALLLFSEHSKLSGVDVRYETALVHLNFASLLAGQGLFYASYVVQKRGMETLETMIAEGIDVIRLHLGKAYSQKGAVLRELERFDEAAEDFDKSVEWTKLLVEEGMLEQQEPLAQALITRSIFSREHGRFETALADLKQALSIRMSLLEEGNPLTLYWVSQVHSLLAFLLEQLGRFEESLVSFERAICALLHLNDHSAIPVFFEAQSHIVRQLEIMIRLDETEMIEKLCDRAMKFHETLSARGIHVLESDTPRFTMYRAMAAQSIQNWDKAIALFDEAIGQWQSLWIRLQMQHSTMMQQQKTDEIQQHVTPAMIACLGELERCQSCVAAIYEENGDQYKAIVSYGKSIILGKRLVLLGELSFIGNIASHHIKIGAAYESLECADDALENFEKALFELEGLFTSNNEIAFPEERIGAIMGILRHKPDKSVADCQKLLDQIIEFVPVIGRNFDPAGLVLIATSLKSVAQHRNAPHQKLISVLESAWKNAVAEYMINFDSMLLPGMSRLLHTFVLELRKRGQKENGYAEMNAALEMYAAAGKIKVDSLGALAATLEQKAQMLSEDGKKEDAIETMGIALEKYVLFVKQQWEIIREMMSEKPPKSEPPHLYLLMGVSQHLENIASIIVNVVRSLISVEEWGTSQQKAAKNTQLVLDDLIAALNERGESGAVMLKQLIRLKNSFPSS